MDANINIEWVFAAVNRHQPSAMREPIHREKREHSARMIKIWPKRVLWVKVGWRSEAGTDPEITQFSLRNAKCPIRW